MNNPVNQVQIRINLPDSLNHLSKHKPCLLVFYALPNGNNIDWTAGKRMEPGDDWHFAIQQIAAQTRFVRNANPKQNLILVYLATEGKAGQPGSGPEKTVLQKSNESWILLPACSVNTILPLC